MSRLYVPGINPFLVQLGPIHIRWYGFFMAVAMACVGPGTGKRGSAAGRNGTRRSARGLG